MNPIKAVYCRAVQAVFRAALPVLPYREPEIFRSCAELYTVFSKKHIQRVLIVTDEGIVRSGIAGQLEAALDECGVRYTVYSETRPNPTVANVEAALRLYRRDNCQALIAIGGGSSMDCAKAVGARIARPRTPLGKLKGTLRILHKLPTLIAIPTTAGTGSETTLATVITDDKTSHKFPINDFPLIPRVAVLDPEMTRSLPKNMTATTGMDALTHAIEAYIGRSTTKTTRRDALKAASLIAGNLEKAYRDGNDMAARANMLTAAFLAGGAFSKSYVGYCHAVAHSLGGKYHTPHGLANAVLLPYVLEAYGSSIDGKAKDIAVAMGISDASTPPETAARLLIAEIRRMNRAMGIPAKLPGIQEADIPRLAAYAAKEANPLYPVPVLMNRKELEQFYYDVMEESK